MGLPQRATSLDALVTAPRDKRAATPAGLLRRMLSGESVTGFKQQTVAKAHLLGAVYRGVICALAVDLGTDLPQSIPRRRSSASAVENLPCVFGVDRLAPLPLPVLSVPRPAFLTRAYFGALPKDFVRQVVSWAPPVVALPGKAGSASRQTQSAVVLGNLISAFLAAHCLSGETISVNVLTKPTAARYTLAELVRGFADVLNDFVEREVTQIIVAAPDLALAQLLTGGKRATVARVRQRHREGTTL